MKIANDMYVAIDYCLTLESGEEIDRSEEGEPLSFITGSGMIIPGLEDQLLGMSIGESANIIVGPADGYGEFREDLCQTVPRSHFPPDVELIPGQFQAEGPNGPVSFEIKSVTDEEVVADFNHPMAGKQLHFAIKILEVREPSEEEKAAIAEAGGCGCGCGSSDEDDQGCDCGSSDESDQGCGCGSGCSC
ncbi:MAG: peptidylprolyl isomerase [Proteobacteria bacterium]|nr:peptidylprolyl isomerase [Pseudomonadota bacterium]MBU1709902.1 peptidylprolyl isomerase [Pseudomonadota bacterium]